MKKLLVFFVVLVFFSCKVSDTHIDDVYFSPSPIQQNNKSSYVDLNDRYLGMKSRGNRWSTFDDDFWYWNLRPNSFRYDPFLLNNWSRFDAGFWYPNWGKPFISPNFMTWNYFGSPFYSPWSPFDPRFGSFYNPYPRFGTFYNPYVSTFRNVSRNNSNYKPITRGYTEPRIIRAPNYYSLPQNNPNLNSGRRTNLDSYNRSSDMRQTPSNSNRLPGGSAPIRKFDQ